MGINFPLVLVLATLFTGLVWLFDIFFLRQRREKEAEAIRASNGDDETIEKVLKEPVVVEYSASFFPVLAIVLVLRSFLFEPFQIPTGSMIPTLQVGDFILVIKYSYGVRLPVIGTKIMDLGKPKNCLLYTSPSPRDRG